MWGEESPVCWASSCQSEILITEQWLWYICRMSKWNTIILVRKLEDNYPNFATVQAVPFGVNGDTWQLLNITQKTISVVTVEEEMREVIGRRGKREKERKGKAGGETFFSSDCTMVQLLSFTLHFLCACVFIQLMNGCPMPRNTAYQDHI